DSGLIYLNARWYDPSLSRFTRPDKLDPIKRGVGPDQYGYAGGDPVNNSDPSGRCIDACAVELFFISSLFALTAMAAANINASQPSKPSNDDIPGIGHNGGPPLDNPQGAPEPQKPNGGPEIALGLGMMATADQLNKTGITVHDGIVEGSYRSLKSASIRDSHHIIQNASVLNILGYNPNDAPAIGLPGPAYNINSPHGATRPAQRAPIGGTYGIEFEIARQALKDAELTYIQIQREIDRANEYFEREL
ncbi:RHS repeat-associated core domain-containing protein, partial [Segnochrobactraceae bacterium EtOH-i3]